MLIIVVIGILLLLLLTGCKPNVPTPIPVDPPPDDDEVIVTPPIYYDPNANKWKMPDKNSALWLRYIEYMTVTHQINSDTLLALEMSKKVKDPVTGKTVYFYEWTSDEEQFGVADIWPTPENVWSTGRDDCDGFRRLTGDVLGRFCKYPDVHALDAYGYYRHYYYDSEEDKWKYKLVLGGHAITVYSKPIISKTKIKMAGEKLIKPIKYYLAKKIKSYIPSSSGLLKAFSNREWLDEGYDSYVTISEDTFPEGIVLLVCRNWKTGKIEWFKEAQSGTILDGTNIFNREQVNRSNIHV